MPLLKDIGQQALGAVFGIGLGAWNDRRQQQQQEKLMQQQIRGSKEMTDYNYMKQLQMWRDTNYTAQMEELRKAGLNPGLLYGMSGGGGTTTGSGGSSITGATATQGGGGEIGMGIQAAQSAAQIKLMEAQAANLDADTKNKGGVIPENIQAQTQDILQGISNKKAQEILTKAQTRVQNITAAFSERNIELALQKSFWETSRAIAEAESANYEAGIDRQTVDAKVLILKQQAIGSVLENTLKSENIALTKEQNLEVRTRVATLLFGMDAKHYEMSQKDREIAIQKQLADFNTGLSKELTVKLAEFITRLIAR